MHIYILYILYTLYILYPPPCPCGTKGVIRGSMLTRGCLEGLIDLKGPTPPVPGLPGLSRDYSAPLKKLNINWKVSFKRGVDEVTLASFFATPPS